MLFDVWLPGLLPVIWLRKSGGSNRSVLFSQDGGPPGQSAANVGQLGQPAFSLPADPTMGAIVMNQSEIFNCKGEDHEAPASGWLPCH